MKSQESISPKLLFEKNINKLIFSYILFLFSIIGSNCMDDMMKMNTIKPFNDDSFIFNWSIDEMQKKILINIQAKTTGWVGIGFSKDGTMVNSDMILCYITKSGTANCSDRYSKAKVAPELDTNLGGKTNLDNISGNFLNGTSSFSFSRLLNTGDNTYDFTIEKGKEINMIFSFRDTGNPDTENGVFLQHTKSFGKSVILYPDSGQSIDNNLFLKDTNLKKISLKFNNYPIPTNTTTYVCKNFNITQMVMEATGLSPGTAYHSIAYEPIIDKVEFMHHIVIFSCERNVVIDNSQYECAAFSPNCQKIHFEWAPGSGKYILPENVGILWGVAENKYIMVQNHYNNPQGKSGFSDSSYVNVYFTNQLRKFDAATLLTGVTMDFISIPPKTSNYIINDSCGSSCTQTINGSINIISVFLHGHTYLRKIRTEIIYKNGTVDSTSMRDDSFRFNNQKFIIFDNPLVLSTGDSMKTFCEYDTSSTDMTVPGGEASSEEMCFSFINYYPRENGLYYCMDKLPPVFGCQKFTLFNRTENQIQVKLLDGKTNKFEISFSNLIFLFVIMVNLF